MKTEQRIVVRGKMPGQSLPFTPDLAGTAETVVYQLIHDCFPVRLSDSTKFHRFRYRGQRSAQT
jgi:hypothetical protein